VDKVVSEKQNADSSKRQKIQAEIDNKRKKFCGALATTRRDLQAIYGKESVKYLIDTFDFDTAVAHVLFDFLRGKFCMHIYTLYLPFKFNHCMFSLKESQEKKRILH
jgi:hypothetical protein